MSCSRRLAVVVTMTLVASLALVDGYYIIRTGEEEARMRYLINLRELRVSAEGDIERIVFNFGDRVELTFAEPKDENCWYRGSVTGDTQVGESSAFHRFTNMYLLFFSEKF